MKAISLPKQAYPLNSAPESAEDLLNFYAEPQPPEALSPLILRSTPGASLFVDIGASQHGIQTMYFLHGYLFVVNGPAAYRIDRFGVVKPLGEVGDTPFATIALGQYDLVICTPPNAYYCNVDGTLEQITGEDFPSVSSVAYLHGYYVFSTLDSGTFFISKLSRGATFDPLDFASIEAVPDVIRVVVAHLDCIWLFGDYSVEVWYDAGAADFPFRRQQGGIIYTGTIAANSVTRVGNSLCWLGRDGKVYQAIGTSAKPISTFALDDQIIGYSDVSDAQGMFYSQGGHDFYVLTFPRAVNGAGATWVYDNTTSLWHRRSSSDNGIGQWRARSTAQFGSSVMIGDHASSRILIVTQDLETDDGVLVPRVAVFPPIPAGSGRAFMSRFELEMEVGASPLSPATIHLDWSDDGTRTFKPSGGRLLDSGTYGQFGKRVITTRLGSFLKNRVLRLKMLGHATLYYASVGLNGEPEN
jgi:hypothetical protein